MFYVENNGKSHGAGYIKAIKLSLAFAGILVFVLLLMGTDNAKADTTVPAGDVNNALYPGGWTSSGSPYWIEGNITVPNSISPQGDPSNTLTIDGSSGAIVIKFNGSYSLRVGESGSGDPASLIVSGDSKNILFTRNETWITWEGIEYTDSAISPSIFDNATVEYVAADLGVGIRLNGTSNMKITNCEVRHVTGFEEAVGIGLFNRMGIPTDNNVVVRNLVYNVSITNSDNASAYGIYVVRGLANTISNNTIEDISVTGGGGKGLAAGIYLVNSSFTSMDQNNISRILCDRDEALGMGLIDDSDWNDIFNSRIVDIHAQFPGYGNAYGIGLFGVTKGHSTDYNDILNNTIQQVYSDNRSSYGISIRNKATRNSVSDNWITNIKSYFSGVNASGIDLLDNTGVLIANNTLTNIICDSQNASFGLKFKDSDGYLISNNSFYMISSNGSAWGIYNFNSTDTQYFNLTMDNITGESSVMGSYSEMTENITFNLITIINVTGPSGFAWGIVDYNTTDMSYIDCFISDIFAGSGVAIGVHAVSANHSNFQDIFIEYVLSANSGAFGLTGWDSNNMNSSDITIQRITGISTTIGIFLLDAIDHKLESMVLNEIESLESDSYGLRTGTTTRNILFSNSSISNVTTDFSGAEAIGIYEVDSFYNVYFNLDITNIESINGAAWGMMLDLTIDVTVEEVFIDSISGNDDNIAGIYLGKTECKGTKIYDNTITNITNIGTTMGIYSGDGVNDTSISGNIIYSLDYGIYVTNNTVIRIGNCTIYNNQFGIWANNNSYMNLYNNEIYDNVQWGLWMDSTSSGDWIVDALASFMNNDGFIYGDLTVWPSGNLLLRNTTFSMQDVSSNGTVQVQQARNTIISWNLTVDGPFTLDDSIWEINNTFDGEHWIMVEPNANLMVINNSLITAYDTDYRYDFWVNGSATFQNSIIEYAGYSYNQGSYGVHVTTDSVLFDNMVFRFCRIGIYVNGSTPEIGNITIYNCSVAIALVDGDTMAIQNISIWNITPPTGIGGAGIYVDNYHNVSLTDIDVDGPFTNAGGIMFIGSQGGWVYDSTLKNIDTGLDVNASEVTVINTHISGNQNGIRAVFGAQLTALDCNISDNIDIGISFEDSGGLLDNCTISSNGVQGVFVINSIPKLESCTISDPNQDYAIYCQDNGSPLVANSTLSSGISDFIMDTNSHPVSLNSSFDKSKVTFLDAQSTLTVQWYLHIRVESSLGQGVPFAYVRVKDNENGTYDSLFSADSQGYVNWIVTSEYIENSVLRTNFTPHNLRAWNATLLGKRSQFIDASMLVIIILDTPSEVMIGKIADNVTVGIGEYITYTLWYNNTIAENITHVYINDTLSLNLNYISDSSGIPPDIIGNTYSWYIGNVTPGNHSFQLVVKTKGGVADGTIINNEFTFEYSDQYYVPMLILNSNEVSSVILAPEMNIEKSVENLTIDLGQFNTYTIWYNNTGGGTAKVVWLNDTLHTNLTIITSSAEGNRTGTSWKFFDVGPGSHFITVVVQLDPWVGLAGLEIENQATMEYLDYGSISGPSHISNYANFTVLFPPEVDFIRIEYLAGGLVGDGTTLTVDEDLVLFARGYNETKGLVGDVEVDWVVNGGIGTTNVSTGTTITFDATTVGIGNILASSVEGINVTGSITVIPGAAADIKIVPAGPETYNADETRDYRVYGYDSDGNLNTTWVAQWSWDGSNLGDLTQLTPDEYNYSAEFNVIGSSLIRVSVSGNPSVFNTSSVTVLAGKVVEIIITPGGLEINTTDDVLNFTVSGYDADGNLNVTWTPSVSWTGPDLGIITINGYKIEVEFTNIGSSIINVSDSSDSTVFNDTKGVTVNLGSPYRLVYISGRNQFGFPNAQLISPFTVRVEDYDGNYIPNVMINWSLDGWPLGANNQSLSDYNTMTNSSGVANTTLTLGDTNGVYYVNATSITLDLVGEPVSFYATVTEFTIDDIIITDISQVPIGDIELSADDTITLYAWSYNKTGGILGSFAVNWSSSGGIGDFTTSWVRQPQVTFDLTTLGEGDITAQFSNATLFLSNITGTITVRPGKLASIVVTPPSVTSTTDGLDFYYAVGYDGDGNENWTWTPQWDWEGTGLGSLTEIDLFNYSVAYDTVGVDVINVSSVSNPNFYSTVSVTVFSGEVVRIEITPWPSTSATTDEIQGFGVTGYDTDGNQNWSWAPQWQWDGPILGALTPIDTYNYSVDYNTIGSSQIKVSAFANPTVFNSTSVTVTAGELVEIIITPGGAETNTTDDVLNFMVSGYDADGNLNSTWTPIVSWEGDDLGIITLNGYIVEVEFMGVGTSIINVSDSSDSALYNNTKGVIVNPGSPYRLLYISGRDQIDFPNVQLLDPFVVKVEDYDGNPVANVLINWSLDRWPSGANNQLLSDYNTLTNAEGLAETTLTLGDTQGIYYVNATNLTQVLVGEPMTFSATVSMYSIDGIIITDSQKQPLGDIELSTDDTLTLYAWTYNETGGILGSIAVNWSASGSIGGFTTPWISQTWVTFDLTALGEGDITAQFTNATVSLSNMTGKITVRLGALAYIVLTPSSVTNTADGSDIYMAIGYDADVNQNWSWAPQWNWEGAGLGVLIEIDLYNYSVDYDTVGFDVIRVSSASDPNVFDRAMVSIRAGEVLRIEITPWPSISVTTDDTGIFRVVGYDADGNVNWTWTSQWDWVGLGLGILTPIDVYNYSVDYTTIGSDQIRVSVSGNPAIFNTTAVTAVAGKVVEIIITPGGLETNTTDDVLNFTVSGYDADGNLNDLWTPFVSWTGDNLGNIIVNGFEIEVEFTGVGTSIINVSDSADSKIYNDTKSVTVNTGSPYRLVYISGRYQFGFPDTQVQSPFFVRVEDYDGNPVPNVLINWSLDGWPSGANNQSLSDYNTLTDSVGVAQTTLTLGDTQGVYFVNATNITLDLVGEPVSFYATVTLYSIDGIVITDALGLYFGDVELSTDDTITLYATAYNTTEGILGSVAANWSASGSIGIFTSSDILQTQITFDLTTVGQGDITALFTNATLSLSNTTGTITVRPGILVSIVMTPSSVTDTTDGFDLFNAVGYDADSNQNWSWTPQWIWEGSVLGSFTFIDQYNLSVDYDKVGVDFIRVALASDPNIYDRAQVTILPGQVVRIDISPWPSTSATTDDTQVFSAIGFDSDGNENWEWTAQWDWMGLGLGPLTPIDDYNYSVDYDNVGKDTLNVMVSGNPSIFNNTEVEVTAGQIVRIDISPWPSSFATTDDIQGFSVVGYDSDSNENWLWTPQWEWVGLGLGMLTPIDNYNYSVDYNIVGTDAINVMVSGNPAIYNRTSVFVSAGDVVRIDISTWPSTLVTTDDIDTISVIGYDLDGNENWIWNPQWDWVGPGLGTLTSFDDYNYSVDYENVGTDTINVMVAGNPLIYNNTEVEVTAGQVVRIEMSPWPTSANFTGDTGTYNVIGYDADENENWTWIPQWAWEATGLGLLNQITPFNYTVLFTLPGSDAIKVSVAGAPSIFNTTSVDIINPPSIDYIVIMDAPNGVGNAVGTLEYNFGDTDFFYAAGFNYSSGYVKDIEVLWTTSNESIGNVTPGPGTSATFSANLTRGGNVIITATNSSLPESSNSTGTITVIEPEVDYIQIRDAPDGGGNEVISMNYTQYETDIFFAAGYNNIVGYIGDVNVNWESYFENVGTVSPLINSSSTTFSAKGIPGSTFVTAVYRPGVSDSTSTLTVTGPPEASVDYIMIRDAPAGGGSIVTVLELAAGDSVTLYCAGYNTSTENYVKDVVVTWEIDEELGTIDTISGTSTIFTASSAAGLEVAGNLTATYNSISNSTFITVDLKPTAPEGLTVSKRPQGQSLILSWTAGAESDVVGYRIYRSDQILVGFSLLKEILGRDNTTYTDTNLIDGVTYTYYIQAFDRTPSYSSASAQATETSDSDTDGDGQYNTEDLDDDADGLSDSEEAELGTSPVLEDTDGDGYIDSEDDYPLDISKWEKEDEAQDMFFLLIIIVIIIVLLIVVLLAKRRKPKKEIPYERKVHEEVSMEDMKAFDEELEMEEVPEEEYYEEEAGEGVPQEEYYEEEVVQDEPVGPVEEEIEAPDDVDTALKEVEKSLKALEGLPPPPPEEVAEEKIGYEDGAVAKETYYEEAGEEGLSAEEFECPECGYPVSITVNKCPNCGVEFEDEE